MLIHHIFILLLSWRCARAIENEEALSEGAFDQVATASESLRVSFIQSDNSLGLSGSSKNSSTQSTVEAATIHYENSNGFVPMTSIDRIGSKTSKVPNITAISDYDNADESSMDVRELGLFENDPAYSTEARMFLNLAGPGAERRSFDTQDGQGEFELLKVNNETPAIANYHEFYENLQSNLNRNRAGTQERYEQSKQVGSGRTVEQNKRTKERIKKIEKYLTNYRDDQKEDNTDPYEQYYNNFPTGSARPTSKQKEVFEPEKVQTTNFHQQSGSSIYDTYGDNPVRQRMSSMLRSNYDDNGTSSRQKSYPAASTKNRHSKPVVVVEPSNYKLDVKYGSQQAAIKPSNIDNYRNRKHLEDSKVELGNRYDAESHVNREDRYDNSYERSEDIGEYSEEGDYLEITDKPRRVHKSRRRPYTSENSRRLPKEHRGHVTDDLEPDDSRKNNSPTRPKLHRPKVKPAYWIEDDRSPLSEENTDEVPENVRQSVTSKPDNKNPKHNHKPKGPNSWSQVGPNIEVSHSNGFEVGQVDKPNILVPVNLNLVPVPNFDHSSALSNGQGFDFTNIPNLVTAAPIVSSSAPVMSTSQSILSSGNTNSANSAKNIPIQLNNNYGLPTAVPPDIIVGHSTFQNPVQAVILPQMNNHNKFSTNLRSHYAPSTITPMFAVTRTLNPSLQNIGPTIASIPASQTANPINHNLHHFTSNSVSPTIPQFLVPQTTIQTFPMLHSPYDGNSNYNIFVNPNGLHGQNLIQNGHANSQSTPMPNSQPSSTTPQPNSIANNQLHTAESQIKKNSLPNSNGQFVATASFSVGNGGQQQQHHHYQQQQQQQSQQLQQQQQLQGNNVPIDGKLYFPSNNQNDMNNHNYYNGNQYNPQAIKPQHDNIYQIYRDNANSNGKTYMQTAQVVPAIIHSAQGIPIHFNNRNYANIDEQLQEQQSISRPSVVTHGSRDQNQQILKAANDIFENTWKQLQQLQNNGDAVKKLPHQNIYRVNDNIGSTSNAKTHATNALSGIDVNSAKAHLPMLPAHNVEIINPNMKPSPVDLTLINPYDSLHHYPAAVITTPIPIFTTTTSFLAPRPAVTSTTPETINLHNYVDTLTQIGAQPSNQVNKLEVRPGVRTQDNQQPIFNPINFVPNMDVVKSQSMLNSQVTEPLPNQLNLVPVIPGGNFFKNTYGAQTELIQKPRLSSDLEKYAEEMVKESLKTIYNTQKWNNDRRLKGNYSAAELNELIKLKSELQRFKASLPESKYNGKDILEAHHSETKVRTVEPSSSQPTKKPELSIADIEQFFKTDFKLNVPGSGESSHPGSRHNNRPVNGHLNDFRNLKQLSDYLTPPKPNSFVSKSPFIDSPAKKRPGSTSSRYNSNNGNPRLSRPSSSASRPASGSDTAASNNLESGVRPDGHHRHEKYKYRPGQYSRENNDSNEPSRHSNDHSDYRSYPSLTTGATPEIDSFRSSSNDQSSKSDYYDINHPRMHNLLGLLMKNKQLPAGSSQSYFRDEDDLKQYFENEKRRTQSQFNNESTNFQKKYDTPVDMGPPNSPQVALVRYYPGRRT